MKAWGYKKVRHTQGPQGPWTLRTSEMETVRDELEGDLRLDWKSFTSTSFHFAL